MMDWSDAFANARYIKCAEEYPNKWSNHAKEFRKGLMQAQRAQLNLRYGPKPRNVYDLFLPIGTPKGLVFFVHGGFWRAFDKNSWSHLAKGCIDRGYAVSVLSYTLCPEANIADITLETASALEAVVKEVVGPINLVGHSAGGHLISRLLCQDMSFDLAIKKRIGKCISISGVHDLRPLLHTEMNSDLRIDLPMAQAESPVLLPPRGGIDLCCWVGSDERPEFIRQSQLLADMWLGFDVHVEVCHDDAKHHFDVVEGLCDSQSSMVHALLG